MQDDSYEDRQPIDEQPISNVEQPTVRRLPLGAVITIVAVLMAGSATAWWTWNRATSQNPQPAPTASVQPTVQPSVVESPTTPSPVAAEQTVQVYWLKDTGTNLEVIASPVAVDASAQPDMQLKSAFSSLLKGPENTDVSSTIPPGTELLGLTIQEDGVHVNLSQEFTSGGGSASMSGRLGQVVYTASTLDPSAPVWLSIEGKPLEVLGGEGLLVDQPMTRDGFKQNFPL